MTRPMGRPPKPSALKALEGNPGRRPLGKAPVAAKPKGIPPIPSDLKAAGRAAWTLYWTEAAAWLAKADIPIVQRLCRVHDLAALIEARLEQEGYAPTNEKTGKSYFHSLTDKLLGLYSRMDDMGSLLGFDPVNRERIRVERPPIDALAEWESSA